MPAPRSGPTKAVVSSDSGDAPRRHRRAKVVVLSTIKRETSKEKVSTIGLDLDMAKNMFQAHGGSATRVIVFRKLRREQLHLFFASQRRCCVAMETCASAHHWALAMGELERRISGGPA